MSYLFIKKKFIMGRQGGIFDNGKTGRERGDWRQSPKEFSKKGSRCSFATKHLASLVVRDHDDAHDGDDDPRHPVAGPSREKILCHPAQQ